MEDMNLIYSFQEEIKVSYIYIYSHSLEYSFRFDEWSARISTRFKVSKPCLKEAGTTRLASAAIRGARTPIKQDETQGGDSRFLGGTGRCFEKTVSEKGA